MRKETRIVALYERLSHDDANLGESFSIQNQKKLLEDYAKEKGLSPIKHFSDDGISGTRFDRPAFMEVLDGINDGTIGTLIVKDMSRLGRDYLVVGQLQELMRKKDVRLIAVNDNHDSLLGEDEFLPFRNIMNEWYARDISKKIRSTFKAKGKAGKHVASVAPYGYLKDPNDGNHWVVDEEAAEVVRQIFRWTMEGFGPYQICCKLREAKVEIPGLHLKRHGQGLHQKKEFKDPYNWTSSTVAGILRKREYLGHTVNFKTRKHFKDKKSHYVDPDEWQIFENTQEPIIDEETFNNVQRIRDNVKRYPDGWGEIQPFTGLVFCSDCGGKLYCHRRMNGKHDPTFVCGNYGKMPVGTLCSSRHAIKVRALEELVKSSLKQIKDIVIDNEEEFLEIVSKIPEANADDKDKKLREQLSAMEKRKGELEILLCKIYEDNALGTLPDERYHNLNIQYTTEQSELNKKISMIENEIGSQTNEKKDSRKFLEVLKRYTEFEELTPYMINEFIEKIVVHERDRKGSIDTTQQVDIYFNFIGNIELPKEELSAEEQEELRKKEELKDRLHRNYVRRKESGHQKQWEASYAARRRARMLELKAENPDTYGIPLPEYRKMVRKQREAERKALEEALS